MDRQYLPPSLMITSIIGFLISAIYTASGGFERLFLSVCDHYNVAVCPFENFGMSLGFAFCLAFIIMFIASMISITPSDRELAELK